ncbi:arginase family protein [Azospirillum griseum]|nr:arginase family protein [Azospirillum griseum]
MTNATASETTPVTPRLTLFRGRSADRNPRAMAGAERLGAALAHRLGRRVAAVGAPEPPIPGAWRAQLTAARPALRGLADALALALNDPFPTATVMGRCAAALATLPVVAQRHPDACVVWFDAHGDVNTPGAADVGYLGGMVVSAACGLWDSGLGAGLALDRVVLVAARDLDPPEQALIASGALRHLPVGPDLPARLAEAVAGRPVYVHLDVDSLDAGLVPSEYQVADGLPFADLHAACKGLADQRLIGLEIAEFEDAWPDGRPGDTAPLLAALDPLLRVLASNTGTA